MSRHRRAGPIARLAEARRYRLGCDPLMQRWARWRDAGETPGAVVDARVMVIYGRLWDLAVIRADRKLHRAVLP